MATPMTLGAAAVGGVLKRDDVRGLWPQAFNADVALLYGEAFAAILVAAGRDSPKVVVGHDVRSGSVELALAFCRGVRQSGGQVEWLGLVSTEHVYYMTGQYPERYAGGAVITASHNPAEYNGIKFVFAGARPLGEGDLKQVRDEAVRRWQPLAGQDPRVEFAEFALRCAGLTEPPRRPPVRVHVVVAVGNGVGGHAFGPLAERLAPWGFEFAFVDPEPDGTFPHGVPNPLLPEFVRRLGRAVRAQGARLGIGFDGDGDRAGFVDGSGREIPASQVLALTALGKLATAARPAVVMRNLCCSQLLVDECRAWTGVTLVDTPVGHSRIKLLMRHPRFAEQVVVAGEHSGHYFYPEFFHVDSGMLTALYMLRLVADERRQGRCLEERLRPWRRRYAWSGEINYTFSDPGGPDQVLDTLARAYGPAARCRYEVRADPELDGLGRVFAAPHPYDRASLKSPDLKLEFDRASGAGWWFVLRPSGNEPKLRLNVESWGRGAAGHTVARVADLEQAIVRLGGTRA